MQAIEDQLARLTDSLRSVMERRLETADFGPKTWKLPQPRVCVMEAKRSRLVLGWHSAQRWKQGAVQLNEIVLTPTSVGKGVLQAAAVVAHELVHLANAVAEREDTSRQGRYHNDYFRSTATAMGLIVTRNENYGWCDTRLGADLDEHVRELIRQGVLDSHVFRYKRKSGGVAEASLVKLTAACGTFAYVTRSQADSVKLRCGGCGKLLIVAKRKNRSG